MHHVHGGRRVVTQTPAELCDHSFDLLDDLERTLRLLIALVDDVEGGALEHVLLHADLALVGFNCALKCPVDEALLRAELVRVDDCLLAEALAQPVDGDDLDVHLGAEDVLV